MIKKIITICLVSFLAGCSFKDKYDVDRYYSQPEQDKILTQIVTYIFDAPPLVKMKDRFESKYYNYYSFTASRFSIEKYYVSDNDTHYFYVIRPAADPRERRGVGGSYKMNKDFQVSDFREMFVTPSLPESEVKGRCAFLFDEMVKGTLDQYLVMNTFVQWPNPFSYYDTLTYEWKLKPDLEGTP